MLDGFSGGTILWYRPDAGRGVVKADSGPQYFIDSSCGVTEPVKGLRVLLRPLAVKTGPKRAELKLPPGARQLVELDPNPVRKQPRKRQTAPKTAGKTTRKRTGKGVVQRVKRAGEALERGIPVLHSVHGQGFVVMSTTRIARVKFAGEERQVRVADLQVLERG